VVGHLGTRIVPNITRYECFRTALDMSSQDSNKENLNRKMTNCPEMEKWLDLNALMTRLYDVFTIRDSLFKGLSRPALSLSLSLSLHTHTHTHIYIYIYIYIYMSLSIYLSLAHAQTFKP